MPRNRKALARSLLPAIGMWLGAGAASLLTGIPRWDTLAAIPIYVFLGWAGCDAYRRLTVVAVKHFVGCSACDWHREVPSHDAMRPALLHHIEFECPSDEAAAWRAEQGRS